MSVSQDRGAHFERRDAQQYDAWRSSILWSTSIAYGAAVIATFIVNLAVSHTLTWFWIVLAAIALVFSLTTLPLLRIPAPGWTLLASSLVSLFTLFVVTALASGSGEWVPIAVSAVMLAVIIVLGPVWLHRLRRPRLSGHAKARESGKHASGASRLRWMSEWRFTIGMAMVATALVLSVLSGIGILQGLPRRMLISAALFTVVLAAQVHAGMAGLSLCTFRSAYCSSPGSHCRRYRLSGHQSSVYELRSPWSSPSDLAGACRGRSSPARTKLKSMCSEQGPCSLMRCARDHGPC